MMNSYQTSRHKLLQQALDFLWRQWTSLGVPGNRAYRGDAVLDPEALILITTELGRYDSRLLDLAIDWLATEGKRINLQRLKSLHGRINYSDERVLSGIAEILSRQAVMRKWKSVGDLPVATSQSDWEAVREKFVFPGEESLFRSIDDVPAPPVSGEVDPHFEKYGLLRSRWTPRQACHPPSPGRPENLLLTLRSFLGVNARAEIMVWLLTHDSGYAAAISRDTGYFSKSIQGTLNEMEDSGLVVADRLKREKHFRLKKRDWLGLFAFPEPLTPPRWIAWPWIYYYLNRTIQLLGESAGQDVSPTLRAIQQRGFLDEAAPWLHASGLRSQMSAERGMKGTQLTDAILQDVVQLGELLENDFRAPFAGGDTAGERHARASRLNDQ